MSIAPKVVTRSEADLLHLARGLLEIEPRERIETLLLVEQNAPRELHPAALELLQQTLAQGTVQLLVRAGGWRCADFLRNGTGASGRLWERTLPADLALHFSANSVHFLCWLLVTNLSKGKAAPVPEECPSAPTVGDRLLALSAFEALRQTPGVAAVLRHPLLAGDGFLQLASIDEWLVQQQAEASACDFDIWMQSPGSAILEAWTPRLSAVWDQLETDKQSLIKADELLAVSRAQQNVLTAFLDACERHGRRDLAQFLFPVLHQQFRRPADRWFAAVSYRHLRLEERRELWRTALVLASALDRLAGWNEQARRSRYVDEDYDAAQFWKRLWETCEGDHLVEQAHALRGHFGV
jgi:hypothetical protein